MVTTNKFNSQFIILKILPCLDKCEEIVVLLNQNKTSTQMFLILFSCQNCDTSGKHRSTQILVWNIMFRIIEILSRKKVANYIASQKPQNLKYILQWMLKTVNKAEAIFLDVFIVVLP